MTQWKTNVSEDFAWLFLNGSQKVKKILKAIPDTVLPISEDINHPDLGILRTFLNFLAEPIVAPGNPPLGVQAIMYAASWNTTTASRVEPILTFLTTDTQQAITTSYQWTQTNSNTLDQVGTWATPAKRTALDGLTGNVSTTGMNVKTWAEFYNGSITSNNTFRTQGTARLNGLCAWFNIPGVEYTGTVTYPTSGQYPTWKLELERWGEFNNALTGDRYKYKDYVDQMLYWLKQDDYPEDGFKNWKATTDANLATLMASAGQTGQLAVGWLNQRRLYAFTISFTGGDITATTVPTVSSDDNCVSSVTIAQTATYSSQVEMILKVTLTQAFMDSMPFGWIAIMNPRSTRSSTFAANTLLTNNITRDNDLTWPIVRTMSYGFDIYIAETYNSIQNITLDGLIRSIPFISV